MLRFARGVNLTGRKPRRARNLEELEQLLPQLFTAESTERGLAFQPRPTDIIISPYAKCGTTWLQQIAHGLRSGGSMDFEEITVVTPWLEMAWDMGWDLTAEQVAEPRVFKSHVSWHHVPKGARYICSFRDPADAFVSFYRFFEGFMFEPGAIGIEEFFRWRWPRERMGGRGLLVPPSVVVGTEGQPRRAAAVLRRHERGPAWNGDQSRRIHGHRTR